MPQEVNDNHKTKEKHEYCSDTAVRGSSVKSRFCTSVDKSKVESEIKLGAGSIGLTGTSSEMGAWGFSRTQAATFDFYLVS